MTSVCYCICIQTLWLMYQLIRQGAKCNAVCLCVGRIEQAYHEPLWFGLTATLKVLCSQAKCRRLASVQIIAEVLLSVTLYLGMDNDYTTCSR